MHLHNFDYVFKNNTSELLIESSQVSLRSCFHILNTSIFLIPSVQMQTFPSKLMCSHKGDVRGEGICFSPYINVTLLFLFPKTQPCYLILCLFNPLYIIYILHSYFILIKYYSIFSFISRCPNVSYCMQIKPVSLSLDPLWSVSTFLLFSKILPSISQIKFLSKIYQLFLLSFIL